jgi:hypothetical protein
MLPRAAELYRRQVALGLHGNSDAATKARIFLREWFGGRIRLEPLADGGLMAHWNQNVGALLMGLGTCGRGGRYELYSNYALQIQAVAASVTARPKIDGESPDLSDRVSLCRAIERAPGAF